MGFISYIAIAVGVILLIAGSVIKYVTNRKVKDLDGFIGVIDKNEGPMEDDRQNNIM